MRRSFVLSLAALVLSLTAIAPIVLYRGDAAQIMGVTSADAASAITPTPGFYLVIGASSSLGTQPDGNRLHNGHRTKNGYSDDLVKIEARHGIALTMREMGCPGETVQSILGQLKDACYTLPNTQLSVATTYLKAHSDEVGVVSIDLGFNNLRPCLTATVTITSCVNRGIVAVRNDLPTIVSRLQNAAGPLVHFVGIGYSDPFLAYYLRGANGRVIAQQGLLAMNRLNAVLSAAYESRGVSMANVARSYQSTDNALVTTAKYGRVPQNVAQICAGTWMCTPPPFGPDDHPNTAGYLAIARAMYAALAPLT